VRALRAIALVSLLMGIASCDPSAANGTALFVDVSWSTGSPIAQLRFSSDAGAFPASLRPQSSGAPLSSPQSARVLLDDQLGGQKIDLFVEGLSPDGGVVARKHQQTGAIVQGHELSVSVELAACDCPTGCCAPGAADCYRGNGGFFTCAPTPNEACAQVPLPQYCNVLQANMCTSTGCACGNRAPCPDGTVCAAAAGVGVCICSEMSNCDGCCAGDGGCIPVARTNMFECGNSGIACSRCTGGVGSCSPEGACGGISVCSAGSCLTADKCRPIGFPRCSVSGTCNWCDVLRSDHCAGDGACACGLRAQCGKNETCVAPDAGMLGRCLPLAQPR
jgi:hypothetical protein